jgi:hypothetical protein
MNAKFIRQHLRFGKSRMRRNRRFPKAVWIGAPNSDQFVRAYPKPPVRAFRVEIQLNREAIKRYGLDDLNEWVRLPDVMAKQVRFYRVDWLRLTTAIRRHFPRDPEAVLEKARRLRGNLDELLRFLRRISVTNPSRFLVPMAINADVAEALARWKSLWEEGGRV